MRLDHTEVSERSEDDEDHRSEAADGQDHVEQQNQRRELEHALLGLLDGLEVTVEIEVSHRTLCEKRMNKLCGFRGKS
jgi:hypothetical protein